MEILLDDAAHEERRDSGVERVATAREDLESGRGRQRISRRNRRVETHGRGTLGSLGGDTEKERGH
jgi:hypothetical protein